MDLREAKQLIERCYRDVLPGRFASGPATVMLLSIGLQESRFEHRKQIGGPARSFWQFERAGVRGVMQHKSSARYAAAVCAIRGVPFQERAIHEAMEFDDLLGCAFARLLLFTDAAALPSPGGFDATWDYYIRNWRPGKPHRKTWNALHQRAMEAMA